MAINLPVTGYDFGFTSVPIIYSVWGRVLEWSRHWTYNSAVPVLLLAVSLGQVVHIQVPLSPSCISWYCSQGSDALCLVTAGLVSPWLVPFGVAATSRSTLGSDEMRSYEVSWGEWYECSLVACWVQFCHHLSLAICRPSGCIVVSGVVVIVCNRSQMRTSKCTCLIFGMSIGLDPG